MRSTLFIIKLCCYAACPQDQTGKTNIVTSLVQEEATCLSTHLMGNKFSLASFYVSRINVSKMPAWFLSILAISQSTTSFQVCLQMLLTEVKVKDGGNNHCCWYWGFMGWTSQMDCFMSMFQPVLHWLTSSPPICQGLCYSCLSLKQTHCSLPPQSMRCPTLQFGRLCFCHKSLPLGVPLIMYVSQGQTGSWSFQRSPLDHSSWEYFWLTIKIS